MPWKKRQIYPHERSQAAGKIALILFVIGLSLIVYMTWRDAWYIHYDMLRKEYETWKWRREIEKHENLPDKIWKHSPEF